MLRYLQIFFLFLLLPVFAQQQNIDFKQLDATITFNSKEREVDGVVFFTLQVKTVPDTVRIDAVQMEYSDVLVNNRPAQFVKTNKQIKFYHGFHQGKNTIAFRYKARPRQALYFIGSGMHEQIWTQGQGKYTSHWLPSFDDVNEKLVFNLCIGVKSGTVIANGVLREKIAKNDITYYYYQMKRPMSSYLVMIAVGYFAKTSGRSAGGTPLEWYFAPADKDKVSYTYANANKIFDFLEREIGVAYPWEIYKQVPVRDFFYAGMENTTATVFSQDFVVDAIGFNDINYSNVHAHELAHQWFGNLVTAASGKHHWLQEGFATYYALLTERSLFGEDYFYEQLHEMAVAIKQASATDTIPVMNERASALSFYQKGAWALHALREEIGEDSFRKAVKQYVKKHAYTNVTTDDFLSEVSRVTQRDWQHWKKQWLETPGLPPQAEALMLKNPMLRQWYTVDSITKLPLARQKVIFSSILQSAAYYPIKEEIVHQIAPWPYQDKDTLLSLALATGDLKVRRAVALTMQNLPPTKFLLYRSLLDDASYITREIALNMLYGQFPEYRTFLLNQTAHMIGLNDKNIRLLWLTLALSTQDYQDKEKPLYYDELLAYTSPENEGKIRRNAMEKLLYLNPNDTNALLAIAGLLVHHDWQIAKYARETIRKIVKKETHKQFYEKMAATLPISQQEQLRRLLAN